MNEIIMDYALCGLCILLQVLIVIGYKNYQYGHISFMLLESFVTAILVIVITHLIKLK